MKTKINSETLVASYLETRSTVKTAKLFKVSGVTVSRAVKKAGIELYGSGLYNTRHPLKDDSCLDNIDCEWKAYFLGFFCADGNVSQNIARLGLQESDSYILHQFGDLLFANTYRLSVRPKRKPQHSDMHTLYICNKTFVETLKKLNIGERKSLTLEFPAIPKEFLHHFIRGVFDGDGSISKSTTRINTFMSCFLGSNSFIESLKAILDSQSISSSIYNHPTCSEIKRLTITSMLQMKYLFDFMYKDATIFLSRKHNLFMDMITSIDWGHPQYNRTSHYKGIGFCKRDQKWESRVSDKGQKKVIGKFDSEIEAYNYLVQYKSLAQASTNR